MTPVSRVPEAEMERVRVLRELWEREWLSRTDVPLRDQLVRLGEGELGSALQPSTAAFSKVAIQLELPTNPDELERPLEMLQSMKWATDLVERTMEGLVAECRRRRYSWADIAQALGVARQSAWTKYASLEADEPNQP